MAEVEEVVRHLRRARVPLQHRQGAAHERGSSCSGTTRQPDERLLGCDPDDPEVLGDPCRRWAVRRFRDRQPRILRGDLDAVTVGGEAVAVVRAAQRPIDDRASGQGGHPVRAGVSERGDSTVEAGHSPVLTEQLDGHDLIVGDRIGPGHGVPATAQRRVFVVEPAIRRHQPNVPIPHVRDRGVRSAERGGDVTQTAHRRGRAHVTFVHLAQHLLVCGIDRGTGSARRGSGAAVRATGA